MSPHHFLHRPVVGTICTFASTHSSSLGRMNYASLSPSKSSRPSLPLTSILYVVFSSKIFLIPHRFSSCKTCHRSKHGHSPFERSCLLAFWPGRRKLDSEPFLNILEFASICPVIDQRLKCKTSSKNQRLLILLQAFDWLGF